MVREGEGEWKREKGRNTRREISENAGRQILSPRHTPRGAILLWLLGGKTGPFLFVLASATPLHTQFLTLYCSSLLSSQLTPSLTPGRSDPLA